MLSREVTGEKPPNHYPTRPDSRIRSDGRSWMRRYPPYGMNVPSEREVQALARRIAEAGGEEKSRLFRGSWWSEQLLDWAMARGSFKTQLFRFVDVFPGCRDDDDVMRRLQEYFEGEATPGPERLAMATAVWPAQPVLEADPWGPLPRVNISVKATALAPRFGPLTRAEGLEEARSRLRPLLLRAREVPATIHIDTEHDDVKDLTFELVRALGEEFPGGPALGCVVQAYRKDSYADLRDLVAWSKGALQIPLQIRLVKGAYWDYETVVARAEGWPVPVFEEKAQTDANYERCARPLIDNAGAVRPAFASHNLRSLAYGLAATRAAGLPDGAVELQMLYGMAGPVHTALRQLGQRVRVYAPVGELVPGMAYLGRRLLENTSNESFLRQRSADGKELRHLIRPPGVKDRGLPR